MTTPPPPGTLPGLPDRIMQLGAISTNLSWSWNRDARALFRAIDPPLWHLSRHNPIELLRRVRPERLAACASDEDFLRLYDAVVQDAARAASEERRVGKECRSRWLPDE